MNLNIKEWNRMEFFLGFVFVYFMLHLLDGVTSYILITGYGFQEQNPIGAYFFGLFGTGWGIIITTAIALVIIGLWILLFSKTIIIQRLLFFAPAVILFICILALKTTTVALSIEYLISIWRFGI